MARWSPPRCTMVGWGQTRSRLHGSSTGRVREGRGTRPCAPARRHHASRKPHAVDSRLPEVLEQYSHGCCTRPSARAVPAVAEEHDKNRRRRYVRGGAWVLQCGARHELRRPSGRSLADPVPSERHQHRARCVHVGKPPTRQRCRRGAPRACRGTWQGWSETSRRPRRPTRARRGAPARAPARRVRT